MELCECREPMCCWRSRAEKAEKARKDAEAREAKLRGLLKRIEFGDATTQHKCLFCHGWNVGPNGETARVHTKDCELRAALAAGGGSDV